MNSKIVRVFLAALLFTPNGAIGADAITNADAAAALRKAAGFYREQVSYNGAYLYNYSADLSVQEGEGVAHRTTGWTQPPGTPAVGMAYLDAYRLTGEKYLLDAALDAGYALVEGQLRSGGWDSKFELGPEHRKSYAYRTDEGNEKRQNYTTLDDNKSQSAMMLMMQLDEILEFKDEKIHEAVEYALEHFLPAQYPNGAWPQRFDGPPAPAAFPVKKASYPDSWSRVFPNVKYTEYYTFNDNAMADMMGVLLEAHRIYGKDEYREAALRTGDFMLLAQMPEPQPGWAQQYDAEMHPAWARKFEPASISGGESQGVMRALLFLYRETGEKRFLEPIPRALEYYRKQVLPDGKIARFIELHTDKPLYFTKEYELTYSDAGMPTHYSFKISSKLDSIEREYEKLLEKGPSPSKPAITVKPPEMSSSLSKRARSVIDAMDSRGAWVEKGKLDNYDAEASKDGIISSRTFIENIEILSEAAAAKK